MEKAIKSLKERWTLLKQEKPQLRIRNAAQELGVSEMELLSLQIPETVTRLKPEFKDILSEAENLGKVMALTRNDECVHERKGVYMNPKFRSPSFGMFVNPDIDLRIFLDLWASAFAVVEKDPRNEGKYRKSIHFFGKDGEAIHKIYLTPASNEEAFDALVEKYKSENQAAGEIVEKVTPTVEEKKNDNINIEEFQNEWKNLQDVHDFSKILKKYNISTTQALRLAPTEFYATQINKDAIVTMLEQVAEKEIPIIVFVSNQGVVQIHTGEIKKTMWHGTWFNILDPDFNMHLDMAKIAEAWVVRRPTDNGVVTSIEAYNESGNTIIQFFVKQENKSDSSKWEKIVINLS